MGEGSKQLLLKRIMIITISFMMCLSMAKTASYAEENHAHTEICYSEDGDLICAENEEDIVHNEDTDEALRDTLTSYGGTPNTLLLAQKLMTVSDFASLKAAIENAKDGAETEIVIENDIEFSEELNIPEGKIIKLISDGDKEVTLFPNDTLKRTALINVNANSKLTVDGNIAIDGKSNVGYVECYGKLIVDNARMTNGVMNVSRGAGGITVSGENASFTFNGGSITNTSSYYSNKAALYIIDNAKAVMNGGIIKDNIFDNQFCAAVVVDNGLFEMNDGEISNNKCLEQIQSAGGVLVLAISPAATADSAKKSNFVMNGGKISNNKCFRGAGVYVYGGGVLYTDFYSNASFTMNGGEISGNTATNFSDMIAAGGGVYVEWNSAFIMNDGTISNNSTTGMGGGVATNDGFTNYFGKVPYSAAGNRNYNGIYYRDWPRMFPASFKMNGGNITNNKAMSTSVVGDEGCGGGVYIASSKVVLNAGDISNNASGKQGGGVYVGSVPYILRMYDVLITDNSASIIGGGAWFCPTSDIDLFVNDGGALFGNTAEGAADDLAAVHNTTNYYATIADRMLGGGLANWHQDGAIDTTGQLGYADTSVPRYDADSRDKVPVSNIVNSKSVYSLKADPNAESQELAESLAKLTITGNTSKRGGGIGSNGGVVIGKSYEGTRNLTINKEWIGATETPETVTLWLVINGYRTEKVVVTKAENWVKTITDLPTGKDIIITLEEESSDNWRPSYTYKTDPSGDVTVTVTNTFMVGDLTITKTVSGIGADKTKEFDFTLTLDDNTINGTYGEMEFADGVATFKMKDGDSKTAIGLPNGLGYIVTENNEDYTSKKTGDVGNIIANETVVAAFDNFKSAESVKSVEINVTVLKQWQDNDSKARPKSVSVQLYNGGIAYGLPVILDEDNGWQFEWKELDASAEWTVDELYVPEGYKKTVSHNGNDWVIKNSAEEAPQTGDDSNINIWIMILISSFVGLIAVIIAKRKNGEGK